MNSEDIVICDCGSIEHQLVIYKDTDDPEEVIISIHLNSWTPIWKKIWVAIKYIFGYRSRYGHWDSMVITKRNYGPLKEAIEFLDKK